MAVYIYIRVSTEQQDYTSQQSNVNNYIARLGISPDNIAGTFCEKMTGKASASERKLGNLLSICREGDVIIASELSRFGRNAIDTEQTIRYCRDHGITVHFVKEGIITNCDKDRYDLATELIIKIYAAVAEGELYDKKFRQKGAYAGIKEKFANGEKHRTRRGNLIDHLGNLPGCDTSKAREASAKKRAQNAIEWRRNSVAYKWMCKKVSEGLTNAQLITEFNYMHDLSPENAKIFCTRSGDRMTQGVLSRWKAAMLDDVNAGIIFS